MHEVMIFISLILTGMTGAIFLGVWYAAGRLLDRMNYTDLMYRILRLEQCFFLIPFLFLFLMINVRNTAWFDGVLFLPTPVLADIASVAVSGWKIGVAVMVILMLAGFGTLFRLRREALSCDERITAIYRSVLEELHLEGRAPELLQSRRTQVPFITAVFHPAIVLPERTFTEKEYRIIFIHELTHFRQKDLTFRFMSMLVTIVQWFNPFAWLSWSLIRRWSEYACDEVSGEKVGSYADYIEMLWTLSKRTNYNSPMEIWATYMSEDKKEVIVRAERLESIRAKKKPGRLMTYGLSVGMFALSVFFSGIMSLAAGTGYEKVFYATEKVVTEALQSFTGEDAYEENGVISAKDEERGWESTADRGKVATFSWSVESGCSVFSPEIQGAEGETILISAYVLPDDSTVAIGILDQGGTGTYVKGNDTMVHEFTFSGTGTYRVIVRNYSGETIEVNGSYIMK